MTKGRVVPPQPQTQATPAAEWAATTSLPLPSGRVVEVRTSIGLGAIAAGVGGNIPNPLRDAVARLILDDDPEFDTDEEDSAKRVARTKEYKESMLALASLYVVSPRIVLDREPDVDAGEISGLWISDTDLYALYTAAQAGPRALATFRDAGRARPARPARPAVRTEAQPAAGD